MKNKGYILSTFFKIKAFVQIFHKSVYVKKENYGTI